MRHNSHIFETEVLDGRIPLSERRYTRQRPRDCVVVQGLSGVGKTTLCNAFVSCTPIFPYFVSTSNSKKPSVALTVPSRGIAEGDRPVLHCRFFKPPEPGMAFSRSLSDSLLRGIHETKPAGDATGVSETRCDCDPVMCIDFDLSLLHSNPEASSSTVGRAVEREIQQVYDTCAARSDEVSFVSMTIRLNAPATSRDSHDPVMMTLVESQAMDERPALHLTHTMIFVMSEDEAFLSSRQLQGAQPLCLDWSERTSALVSTISATTTCDGEFCKCCLIVNMGCFVGGRSDSLSPRTKIVSHADLMESKTNIARKWRIPATNIFIFSSQRILAERISGGLCATSSLLDREEFADFARFVQANAERGDHEWRSSGRAAADCPLPPASGEPQLPVVDAESIPTDFLQERNQRHEKEISRIVAKENERDADVASTLTAVKNEQLEIAKRMAARSESVPLRDATARR